MPVSTLRTRVLEAALTAGFLSVLTTPAVLAQDKQPFTTEDALNVASLSIQDVTDDGRYIVATVATQRDRKNVDHMRFGDPTYISPSFAEVRVIDTETGQQTTLFDDKVQVRSFAWSPDGRTLAFLLREGDEYFLHTYDRERDRVRKVDLETQKSIASNSPLMWRPDSTGALRRPEGSGVVLSLRPDGWAETSRQMFLDMSEGPTIVQDSREPFLGWEVVRNQNSLVIPAIVDLPSGDVRELRTAGRLSGYQQSEPYGDVLSFIETTPVKTSYTRNGGAEYELIGLNIENGETTSLREKSETRISPIWNDTGGSFAYADKGDVFVRSIRASEATNMTEDYRTPVSEDDTTKLRYSVVNWRSSSAELLISSQRGYHTLNLNTGGIELIYETPEDTAAAPNLRPAGWTADGAALYFTYSAKDKWERGLVSYDPRTRQMTDLVKDSNLYARWRFSEDGTKVFYTVSDGDMPPELYMADADLRNTTRLTDLNPWLANRTMTRSELIEYLDVDGSTLHGILYYPVDYEPGKKYPLVAEIYEQFFNNGFNHRMNLLANAGFFGFRPSANLETGFPGEGWLKGVTAGINKLIDRGLVDPDKLGVHGTSYGGYATNLLITQTNRFAAAINISGKVNIISFLGDSPKITTRNYRAAESGQDRIGATLWEQPQKYLAHSAILYADRIETPLLMLTGEGDWNVPATNQREMYYALRRLEKEVTWVHYMNAGHGAGRSSTVEDFHDHWNRILGWYTEHFGGKDAAKVADQGGR